MPGYPKEREELILRSALFSVSVWMIDERILRFCFRVPLFPGRITELFYMCVQDESVDGFLRYFFDRMCEQLFVLQFFYRSDRSSVIYGQI